MTTGELEQMRIKFLKANGMYISNKCCELTKGELNLIARGKDPVDEMDRESLLFVMKARDHIKIAASIEDCGLYAIYFGYKDMLEEKHNNTKNIYYEDAIQRIKQMDEFYKGQLSKIRDCIHIVEEPIAYNSILR